MNKIIIILIFIIFLLLGLPYLSNFYKEYKIVEKEKETIRLEKEIESSIKNSSGTYFIIDSRSGGLGSDRKIWSSKKIFTKKYTIYVTYGNNIIDSYDKKEMTQDKWNNIIKDLDDSVSVFKNIRLIEDCKTCYDATDTTLKINYKKFPYGVDFTYEIDIDALNRAGGKKEDIEKIFKLIKHFGYSFIR